MGRTPRAVADLEAAWVRALTRWWTYYNREYLGGALRRPILQLGDGRTRLGEWDPTFRRIAISRHHIRCDPWGDVLDTLRHEMAHQYVGDVLGAGAEAPHGPAFQSACHRLRCEPRAAAHTPAAVADETRVVRLVKKLLSLADSPNEHEAQAAVNRAHGLLLEYNVDLVQADGERGFARVRLGPVKGRHAAWELWLAMLLNEFFFVEVLWARSYDAQRDREGTVLEVYGTATNLELAEYVHGYLTQLLDRLWAAYRARRALADSRERMRYCAGVLQGFHGKLAAQQLALASRGEGTAALVWRGDGRLREYYRYHNPRIETRRTGGVAASEAFHHGLEDGRQVTLRHAVTTRGAGVGGYLTGG